VTSAHRPNNQMHLPGLGVPVDPWTGALLPPLTTTRLTTLRDAERVFRLILHDLDGTTEGSRPGDRRMAMAFTKLEEAAMWAGAAILDRGD
jgi:hypothetical protein